MKRRTGAGELPSQLALRRRPRRLAGRSVCPPLLGALVSAAICAYAGQVTAQQPSPGTWNPPPPPYYGPPSTGAPCAPGQWCGGAQGQPPPPPSYKKKRKSSSLEIGYLYGTSIAWGIGTGVWLDVEAGIENPGLALIMPALFGVAAPIGVFIADTVMDGMPRGLPASIATGMWLGGGLGLGIWAVNDAVASRSDEWGFPGLGRAVFAGSVVGGAGGAIIGAVLEPSPKTSLFSLSGATWGTLIGGAFGGAASQGDWEDANDAVMVGGLVGYGTGLLGSSIAGFAWVPSWSQIGAGWAGFGIGAAATTPIYLVYLAVPDADPRTGLIAQGIGGMVGLGVGLFLGESDDASGRADLPPADRPTLLAVSPSGMPGGGYGISAVGLW